MLLLVHFNYTTQNSNISISLELTMLLQILNVACLLNKSGLKILPDAVANDFVSLVCRGLGLGSGASGYVCSKPALKTSLMMHNSFLNLNN